MLGSIGKAIAGHKALAAIIAVVMLGGVVSGVVYFTTQPSTITVKTGTESFEQSVSFYTTNAAVSPESLQVVNSTGVHNVSMSSSPFLVATAKSGTSGGAFSLKVSNLTQGVYIIFNVTIMNTGTGKLPFAGYSMLNETETGTGAFYAWKANGSNTLSWNNGANIGAVEGNFYPTYNLTSVLNTNQTSSFVSSGMNASAMTNQTLDVIASGPATGQGSSTANPYPSYIAPGGSVEYQIIIALGTYAPSSYLGQSYTLDFSVGPQ